MMHTAPPSVRAPRRRGAPLVIGGVVLAFVMALFLVNLRSRVQTAPPKPPDLGTISEVILRNAAGQAVPISDLRARALVVDLRPVGCQDDCQRRDEVLKGLPRWNNTVARDLLQITVVEASGPDPSAAIVKGRSTDPWPWFSVDSASFEQMNRPLRDQFPKDLFLVDEAGKIRGFYDSRLEQSIREMLLDSRAVIREMKAPPPDGPVPSGIPG